MSPEPDVEHTLQEHRKLLDRLLRHAPPEVERPVPVHREPSGYSKELGAKQEAARQARVRQAEADAATRQKAWEKDAPRRNRITAQIADLDQQIAAKNAELFALDGKRAELFRSL